MHNCPSRLKIAGQNQYQKQLMTIVPCKTSDHIYQQLFKFIPYVTIARDFKIKINEF